MEVLKGVRKRDVDGVSVVKDLLPVVVGLGGLEERADKLVVDLVSHARHENEGRNDTLGARGLEGGRHLAVPDGSGGGQDGSRGAVGHGEQQVVVIGQDLVVDDKVCLGGIAKVHGVVDDGVLVGEGVVAGLADGGGRAGGQVVRVLGVAWADAVRAGSALAIERAAGGVFRALFAGTTGGGCGSSGSQQRRHGYTRELHLNERDGWGSELA